MSAPNVQQRLPAESFQGVQCCRDHPALSGQGQLSEFLAVRRKTEKIG